VNTNLFFGGRNRPDELRNPGESPDNEPGAAARVMLRSVLAQSIPPSDVAGMVVDAIRAERFYVLTDDDWSETSRLREEAILSQGVPPQRRRR
jgi:hypothetical protein